MQDQPNNSDEWVSHLPSAREMYPDIFRPLDDMVDAIEKLVHVRLPVPDDALGNLKIAVTVRALNILKCVKILTENGHWEDAAILTRSMFELLLNLEEVLRDPAECERRAGVFFRFGWLQEYLNMKAIADYDVGRGTYKGDVNALKDLEKRTQTLFSEFLEKASRKQEKVPKWTRTWCGKSAKQLAEASANAMRPHQYRILYSFTSDLVHSSPVALAGSTNLGFPFEMTEEQILQRDKARTVEFVAMAITFCGEILMKTADVFAGYDPRAFLAVAETMRALFGVNVSDHLRGDSSA